ncbi:transcriptional repressor [Actinotalea sp. M2MS4P-6]|uniref:Fur family transcriptional regulator n=1 Tax=Actinotalea sp. M2MS4P-6 TaxID=2983762 RepID=UPI0021E4018B|nr:Fur family transcriptional regulator [Actinotalea sp. M2MS4P-6]MCV2392982.1 transcriptional repressor [Actinotalea sp. M2MS4P-6]
MAGAGRPEAHHHEHTHDVVGSPVAALRSHGLRATAPRLRLLAAMGGRDHLTAEALHRLVDADGGDSIALTTVYRTLESLEQAGLVWATQVPGVGRSYHLGTHPPHAHLYCRVCGTITDLPGPTDDAWRAGVPEGFEVEHVQLTVEGRCAECAAAGLG